MNELKVIKGLEWIYEPAPWAPQYATLCIDPWSSNRGFVHHGAYEGGMECQAAEALFEVVKAAAEECKANGKPCNMAETGTCDSFSTCFAAHALRIVDVPGRVWTGEFAMTRSGGDPRPWPALWHDHGLGERIVACVGDTRDINTWMKQEPPLPETLDVLFIDSDHTFEQVVSEWKLLGPRVRRGGIVLFHDVLLKEVPGVARAVAAISDELNAEPEMLNSCRGLAKIVVP